MENLQLFTLSLVLSLVLSQKTCATSSIVPLQGAEKTYTFYEEYFSDENADKNEEIYRAKQWVAKAKREKQHGQLLRAFKVLMFKDNKEHLLAYADSIVYYSKLTRDNDLIGNAYLSKGIIFYNHKELVSALDNYVIADTYLSQGSNAYVKHKMKYVIAQTKYYLGYYEEALALTKDCEAFFYTENDKAYLSTLHLLALCHIAMGNYKLAEECINKGTQGSKELAIESFIIFFQQAKAINNFYLNKWDLALKDLNDLEIKLEDLEDECNLLLVNFYTAKCYWKLEKQQQALPYLFKLDENLDNKTYIKPEFRETYEMLFEFYSQTGDLKLEIKYIKKLMLLDELLLRKYSYLSRTIQKKYDTSQLIKAQESALQKEKNKKRFGYGIAVIAFGIVLYLIYRNNKNRKKYLRIFNQLMQTDTNLEAKNNKVNYTVDLSDLNPKLVEKTLKNLEKFETEKKYLAENMNLSSLAKALQTNSKYTSRIILRYRGKRTVDYINDLKVNYTIEILKTQPKFRLYTTAALSEEAGFGSAQNLTRAFKAKTDLTPMYFINQLNQAQQDDL